MAERFEIGDYVLVMLDGHDPLPNGNVLGSPGRVVQRPIMLGGPYHVKIHRERLNRAVWEERMFIVTEQDYFLMCIKYEPAPFYKED